MYEGGVVDICSSKEGCTPTHHLSAIFFLGHRPVSTGCLLGVETYAVSMTEFPPQRMSA